MFQKFSSLYVTDHTEDYILVLTFVLNSTVVAVVSFVTLLIYDEPIFTL